MAAARSCFSARILNTLLAMRRLLTVTALALTACGGLLPPGETGGAGGGRALPVVEQLTVSTGSTNVNPLEGVAFEVGRTADAAEVSRVIDQVTSGAAFFDAQGVRRSAATATRSNAWFVLRAEATLAADAWYELRLAAESGYLLRWASNREPATPRVIRFFIGSAPRISHLSRPAIAKPGEKFVIVTFTEAVTLGTLSDGGLRLFAGSDALGGCAWGESACVSTAATLRSTVVAYRFELSTEGPPAVTRVTVAGAASGGGRTFGQAAALHGDTVDGDGSVSYAIDGWFPCGQDVECWRPAPR
jgi:hypothetical protein